MFGVMTTVLQTMQQTVVICLCEQTNWTKFDHCTETLTWCIHIACTTFINQSTVVGSAFSLIMLLVWKFKLTIPRRFWYWWFYSWRCTTISNIGNNLFSWLPTKPYLKGSSYSDTTKCFSRRSHKFCSQT